MSQRILIVEDHDLWRRLICTSLAGRAETETFEVSDGPAAIEEAARLQPAVILLDLRLPGLGGLDVARQLPRLAPRSKVLFASHEVDPDVIHHTLRLGAGYLHKLRCDADLRGAIEAVLEGRRFVSSVLASPHHRHHEVLFYGDAGLVIDEFSRFAGARIRAGHAAIVLATASHREGIVRTLRGAAIDIDEAIERGRCLLLDAAATLETVMVDGVPDCVRFLEGLRRLIDAASSATNVEHPRVAICGECVGLLCSKGDLESAVALEQAGHDLVTASEVDILCAYPQPRWANDDRTFGRVCRQHSAVRCV